MKYRVSQDKNEIENVGGRTVKWVSDAKPEQWLVAVAEDADIKKIVFADYTKEAQYTLPQLKEGTYYIKVFGITDKEIVDEKAPKEFIVQRYDQSNTLTAPELMTPPNNQEYEPFPRLRIGWKSVPGARAYRVQIWNQRKSMLR